MADNSGGNTTPRIIRSEHIGPDDTGDNIEAKRVANYIWDGANWTRQTAAGGGGSSGKPTDAYAISDIEDAGTYKYFGFEDKDGNWYIMRKEIANSQFYYTADTSGYATGWANRVGLVYASYSDTFV